MELDDLCFVGGSNHDTQLQASQAIATQAWLGDVADDFWARIQPLLPEDPRSPKGGRPSTPHWVIFNGILYVLRTGCQWKMLHASTALVRLPRPLQEMDQGRVFASIWRLFLREYDRRGASTGSGSRWTA